MMRPHRQPGRGFTLVELLVASIIGALVIGATYGALSQVIRGRDGAAARQQAFSRASLAAELIARDLEGALRDADLRFAKVAIQNAGTTVEPRDELVLFTAHMHPARPWTEQAEGPERESHFRIMPSGLTAPGSVATSLWRRVDPVCDETPDGGGLAAPLVDGVVSLAAEAADSEQWYEDWDSDIDGLPHAVRFTVVATDDSGRYRAAARRTVAIDRVAPPTPTIEEEEPATDDTGSTATGGNGSTGATGGTGSTGGTTGGANTGGGGRTTGGGGRTTGGGGSPR